MLSIAVVRGNQQNANQTRAQLEVLFHFLESGLFDFSYRFKLSHLTKFAVLFLK